MTYRNFKKIINNMTPENMNLTDTVTIEWGIK